MLDLASCLERCETEPSRYSSNRCRRASKLRLRYRRTNGSHLCHRYSILSEALQIDGSTEQNMQSVSGIALDNLAWSDMALLRRYAQAMSHAESSITIHFSSLCENYIQLYNAAGESTFQDSSWRSVGETCGEHCCSRMLQRRTG